MVRVQQFLHRTVFAVLAVHGDEDEIAVLFKFVKRHRPAAAARNDDGKRIIPPAVKIGSHVLTGFKRDVVLCRRAAHEHGDAEFALGFSGKYSLSLLASLKLRRSGSKGYRHIH
mgnify:CR=1 FL=1